MSFVPTGGRIRQRRNRRIEMLFGAKNQVVNLVGGSSGAHNGGVAAAAPGDATGTSADARLELLAAIWARQTGRTVVVARA
jgi:hypothetical protein